MLNPPPPSSINIHQTNHFFPWKNSPRKSFSTENELCEENVRMRTKKNTGGLCANLVHKPILFDIQPVSSQ